MKELSKEDLSEQLDAIYIGYRLFLTKGRQYKKKEEINNSEFVKHKERAFRQMRKLIQKPEVTEEFVEKYRVLMVASTTPIPELIRRMLKEAGHQVGTKVTEEWYDEKALELWLFMHRKEVIWKCKDFICNLVKRLPAKKPTVTKAFVEKWNQTIAERVNVQMKKDFIREEISLVYPGTDNLIQMLNEAGVEEETK
jgi:hypothetical protein